ncbi:MAG: hypothetical protein PHP83_02200 [Clostridia bacterium]|nr:hypothetical protein [Clostridia bacterium]
MKIFNKKAICIALFLALIVCLSFLLPGYINSKNNVATRDINVSEIGTLSYEEKIEKLQKQFNNIETRTENDISYFNGDINLDDLNFLSTEYEGSDIVKNYQSVIDNSKETISLTSNVVADGNIVSSAKLDFSTEYDEKTGQLFIVNENGNKIDIMAELKDENIEECLVLTAILAAFTIKQIVSLVVISAVLIIVTLNAKQIANDIDRLISKIKDGFISFWDRIKLACGKITAIVLTSAIAMTELLAIEIYEAAKYRKDCYLLCGTITGTSLIPILYQFTNYENARNWIKKGGSVWSPFSQTAIECVKGAGFVPGGLDKITHTYDPYVAERHYIKFTLLNSINVDFGFYHYHTLNKITLKRVNVSAHSFFGLPFIGDPI